MSLNRKYSHDKAESVKLSHLETQWLPQHYESPLRASKKGTISRSHSWWWASHISPKSSKWLQENLAEMDSKVNAMLKIIEEDADSFAKRAEMYYKRRPELVNLVEEFYRTYRALVERHTFLTKELCQNIAPALQAQLNEADHETSSTLPGDPEFEDDNQSDFSTEFSRGHVDEEDFSLQGSRVSFDTHGFGVSQSFSLNSEEKNLLPKQQKRAGEGFEYTDSCEELRKTVQLLEDEKKALTAKVGENEVKLMDLEFEVSHLLSKTEALEAEEKLAKDRFNEALQTLEAENLKLSLVLIACKEENTQLHEARDQSLQEMFASSKRTQDLEKEATLLQQKIAAFNADFKRFEDESKKLQHSFNSTQERNQREAVALKETSERRLEGLQRQIIDLEEENGSLKEQSITGRAKLEELMEQLNEADATRLQLEQELLKMQVVKEALEVDNSARVLRIQELGREVELTQENRQAVEGMLVKANMEVEDIRSNLDAISSEKILLLQKIDVTQREMDWPLQEELLQTTCFRDVEVALTRLLQENDMLRKREAKALLSFSELENLSQVQALNLQQTMEEQMALIAQRDVSLTALMKEKDILEKQGREALQCHSGLEEEISLLKAEIVEASRLAERLCAEVEELKIAKDHAFAKCQQCEEEYKTLKAAEEELKALLSAKVAECSSFQSDKAVIESKLAKMCLEMEELQKNEAALSSEKAELGRELEAAQEQMSITNMKGLQWRASYEDSQSEIQVLRNEVNSKMELISKLENVTISLEEKILSLVNEKENVTNELAVYENKGCALEARVSEALATQADLNEQVALKSLGIKSLEVELAGMRKEKDFLIEKFAACSARAMLLQNQLDKCKELESLQHADLQKYADTIRSMETEFKSLQLSLCKAEDRNDVLIGEQQKSLDEITCLHRKIQDLEEQASHLAEDKVLLVKDLEEQKENLHAQLKSSNNMIHNVEAELLKLHKAFSLSEEGIENSVSQQSRALDAGLVQKAAFPTEEPSSSPMSHQSRSLCAVLLMPDQSMSIHYKVKSLLEERALLISRASRHKEQRDEMESRLQSLEFAKCILQDELKKEHQAAFEARRDVENLEGDLNQLRQQNAKVESELSTRIMELISVQEEACKARTRNSLLEDETQQHLQKINHLTEDVEGLGHQLQDAQQEMDGLKERLSLSAIRCSAAEKDVCQAKEELIKEIDSRDLLRHQVSELLTDVSKLKTTNAVAQKDLAVQLNCVSKLEDELSGLHGERSCLQGEVAQLKAINLGVQNDLATQLECVSKLKDELSGLHGERSLLQEDGDRHAKQLGEQFNQIKDGRKREQKVEAELLKLSALAETLKQSLLMRDSENLKLREELNRAVECRSASEKKLQDEVSFLQTEETKWRNEVTTNSALMAEKVACLRMENAALHEDLSLKLELLLKLEKDVECLKDERSSLSQALQAMAAEMQEYKNDLQMYKEFVIPSLEERAEELQDEVTDLAISIERHVTEIVSLREQLQDATDKLICLHDENEMLKIDLVFNVEILKQVDGVLLASKAEYSQVFDSLGLQKKISQLQEHHLAEASHENEGLSRSLLAVTEERNSLKAEVQIMLAVLLELELLQKELAASRQDDATVRAREPSNMQKLASSRGPLFGGNSLQTCLLNTQNIATDAEEVAKAEMHHTELDHGKTTELQHTELDHGKTTVPLLACLKSIGGIESEAVQESNGSRFEASALLIGMLKEEVSYLQDEICRLQSATVGEGASKKSGARDFISGPQEDFSSPQKSSTASSSSILTEEETQGSLDDVQRLKEENCSLVQEIISLKSQYLATWMENNLIEDSMKDLQAKLTLLQKQNNHLSSEVSSFKEQIRRLEEERNFSQEKNEHLAVEVSACKIAIDRLGGECRSLQEKNAELQEDVEASMQEKRKSEEALHTLEHVIASLERNNRRLHIENESVSMTMKNLTNKVSCLHEDGSELILLMKTKIMAALEEVKLVLEECGKEAGDEGLMQQIMKDFKDLYSSLPCGHVDAYTCEDVSESEESNAMQTADPGILKKTLTELEAGNTLILNGLKARASETNILLEFVVFIRKMLMRFLGNEHVCQLNALLSATDGNVEGEEVDAERLHHQAFIDERLEQELLELKKGRKQLKEELEVRLAEVQQMESVLEDFQVLLEQDEHGKSERLERGEEQRRKNTWAEESARELREMLAQQRRQLGRMQEEVTSGDKQEEAASESQVAVLVRMESMPSMERWDVEQVDLLNRELESLRASNRRHSAELRTISQDLQSMGSIIKEAQEQLLLGSAQDVEEEIISMADLRTQKSSIIDLRAAESRVSVDSTQQLLSPSPGLVAANSAAARRTQSDGSIGQFTLKPRNFGFDWFLLLFSPDRKATGLARSKSNIKPWAALRPIRRDSRNNSVLMGERGRRKVASCWACVANTSRLDSFDGR